MGAYFRVWALWIPLESPSKMRPDGTTFMLFDPVLTELQGKQLWSQQLVRSWLSQQPLSGRTFVVEHHVTCHVTYYVT